MHFTKLCLSRLGRQCTMNEMISSKLSSIGKKHSCDLFVPMGLLKVPILSVRNAHSCSAMMRMIDKTKFNRIIATKSVMKYVQQESKVLVAPWIACQYCDDSSNKQGVHTGLKQEHTFKDALKKKREQLIESEQKLRKTSQTILKDIRETKDKMRERMEDVIERENVWTIPNILCVGRIIASPYLGYLIIEGNFPVAIAVFAFAGVTDLLDGWIARNFKNQSTKLGSFLDPMADKILIGVLFTTLTIAGHISIALTALIIARDLLLVGAGFVIRYKSLPPPRTLSRYFDASLVTAQLQPTLISKVNTVVQLMLVASVMAAPVWNCPSPGTLQALSYLTAATTIAAGLSYVFERNTYHILKKTKK